MQQNKRAIGLDVGTKTIGVAMSDPLGLIAQPFTTLARQSVKKDAAALAELCQEKEVVHLIVGLPLELDDTEARPARLARQVGEALGALLGLTPVYIDERYTSVEAERALVALDLSRSRRKQVIDQSAAALILQSWLDHGDWSQIARP
ncbi:MAG: Holliday junction resolvase RuvX [Alphaproteobacteria bacterium]|nr:Holliday junction resolvase RuvX [Alphaproteobacteria bacterium]